MLYPFVALAYAALNLLLGLVVYAKARHVRVAKFYLFCVGCLVCLGAASWSLSQPLAESLRVVIEYGALFLYALLPFFFIHFITLFAHQKDILTTATISSAIYAVGLFSYVMVLLGYIPRPISPEGVISQSGYIFYLTWMSIFFSIGIALLFEALRGFRKRVRKTDFVLVASIVLLLILPGPFTDSIFFGALHLSLEYYFYVCTFALTIAVYFIFRHKIVVNTLNDALRAVLETLNDVFITTDEFFRIEFFGGKGVSALLGYTGRELIGRSFVDFIDQPKALDEYRSFVEENKKREGYFDANVVTKEGKHVPMNFSFAPVVVGEEVSGYVGIGRDQTDHQRLQQELLQAQKMESLGVLAAGIAHDFNNILQIIVLNSSGLRRSSLSPEQSNRILDINVQAVDRGSRLVQQILTFARKTPVEFKPLDCNALVIELTRMLSATFPPTIKFMTTLIPQIPFILADRNQMHQVLVNLCVNARDAMPDGGTIWISSKIVMQWELRSKFSAAKEDRYVCILVTDTGCGMDEDVRCHIFDPFYTTKEKGKGTGLGLSVVYGIVETHQGFIDVKSQVGVGTTFELYFPVSSTIDVLNQPISKPGTIVEIEQLRGVETILVVEDEEILLRSLSGLLEANGYHVRTAHDGYEALEVYGQQPKDIDLALIDIGLPRLSGRDLIMRMKQLDPSLRIIVSTGYLDLTSTMAGIQENVEEIIRKPYDLITALKTIRRVLDTGEVPVGHAD